MPSRCPPQCPLGPRPPLGTGAHPAAVRGPRRGRGARRVLPVAVDRYGITLRVEYGNGHTDARLPFPSRLEGADQAGNQIQALLNSARRASHRGRLFAGW
ncbi:DUF2470 domain-containing protein [Actinacidiphila glaucinigra]|uniref:DUF2470 domain-containing protein n=1 Tax=Actinacidiphila glaucinigra TaxID=235986 RepID=UPI002E3519F7|nr:DUF2470 domain-containing protein [Actinacidiphila glaucinigra]